MRQHVTLTRLILVFMLALAFSVRADPESEARTLKNEALAILKATSDRDATPVEMATCIFNLEKAAGILETAHDSNSDLATEINKELYWARKRSTLAIDAELDKMHGKTGASYVAPVKKPVAPAKPATPVKPVDPNSTVETDEARKAFDEADKFARSHGDDDYVVSLNWFQVAGMHPGTDFSLKALTLGREAQQRFKARSQVVQKSDIPDTPEMKLIKDADALVKQKDYAQAISVYLASIKMKDTKLAHQRLGQAYFSQAQVLWEDLMQRRPPLQAALNNAIANAFVTVRIRGIDRKMRNPNDPNLLAAQRNCAAFDKECEVVFTTFNKASDEFKAVLRMSPSKKDLIASGFIGMCLIRKTQTIPAGKTHMAQFMKDYTPSNDDERSIYEYCKTELAKLTR